MLLLVPTSSYDLRSFVQLIEAIMFQDPDLLFEAESAAFCHRVIWWILLDETPSNSVIFAFPLDSPDFL